jgi:hypothetical protein
MHVDAFLIQQPSVHFGTLLGLTREALGYSLAAKSDASGRQMSDAERFLSCLEAMRHQNATPALWPHLLGHVSFSVALVADDRDVLDILEVASGMPFVRAETKHRGVEIVLITGTLAQWRDAAMSGTQQTGFVQAAYCKIVNLFVQAGLNVWQAYSWKTDAAHKDVFLIEDKRK